MDLQHLSLLLQNRSPLPVYLLAGGIVCLVLVAFLGKKWASKNGDSNAQGWKNRQIVSHLLTLGEILKLSAVFSAIAIVAVVVWSVLAVQINPSAMDSFANKQYRCHPYLRCQFVLQRNGFIEVLGQNGVASGTDSWQAANQLANVFVRLGDGEVGIYRAFRSMDGAEILFYFLPYQQFLAVGVITYIAFSLLLSCGAMIQFRRSKKSAEDFAKSSSPEQAIGGAQLAGFSAAPPAQLLDQQLPGLTTILAELAYLNADSIRIIPVEQGQGIQPLFTPFSTQPGHDPYERFDPIIRAIAQKTNSLFLQDTNKLFRNAGVQGVRLPSSLFIQNITVGKEPVAILWGAFLNPVVFSSANKKRVAELSILAGTIQAKQAYQADLPSSTALLKNVLSALPDAAILSDAAGCLVLSNAPAEKLLNIDPRKDSGKKLDTILLDAKLRTLMATKNKNNTATEIQLENGRHVLVYSAPSLGGSLDQHKLWLLRDIHPYHEQDRLRSEFLNSVSHDLRGPLSLIRGYTGMIEMVGALNDQQFVYTQKINEAIEDMTRLVNTILDLGRIDAGVRLQLELVTISDVVEGAMSSIRPIAQQRNILLENTYTGGDALIQVDPGLVQQALGNVIENGIKYTNTGGRVTVNIIHQKDYVRFEVSDTGLGISKGDQAHLFEKFFRSQRAEVKARRGSGLGLAIVRSIVEQHHGTVWFESLEGVGSTFFLQLPIRQPQ